MAIGNENIDLEALSQQAGEGQSSGEVDVDMEKFKQQMDAFVRGSIANWYGKEAAEKASPRMSLTPLSEIDHDALLRNDPSEFGGYSMNPDRRGTEYIEKKEIPKIKILDMKECVGKKTISEVTQAIIEQYGKDYRIPDMEDEQYFFSLSDSQVPQKMQDGNHYHFLGSTLRDQDGRAFSPFVEWFGGGLRRRAHRLDGKWLGRGSVLLLEKN